tara:strand:+ start:853 stop:1266 length:414 start_codon:yes stop_codon:yes gene_type:complete
MNIITWGDIRRGTLAIVFVILPTVLLGTYIGPALQSYQITGAGLWELKRADVTDEVIEPLHVLRLKPFFLKFRLMNEVESRIDNPELFKKYKKKIELQLQTIPIPAMEYIFLSTLALYYFVLWYLKRIWFPRWKILK